MSKVITPTIGRKVHFWPAVNNESASIDGIVLDTMQPFDATVVFVHDDRKVNLVVRDHAGLQMKRDNVTLVQDGDEVPDREQAGFACWMPYQLGQAERTRQAEAGNARGPEKLDHNPEGDDLKLKGDGETDASATGTLSDPPSPELNATGQQPEPAA